MSRHDKCTRLRRGTTLCLTVGVASAIGLATPVASQAACGVHDGWSSGDQLGTKVGSNPVRYKFPDSPYMGVRFNSCSNTVTAYYGGWTGNTHYNLRYSAGYGGAAKQVQVAPGPARVYTVNAAQFQTATGGYKRVDFAVQACRRGSGLFSTSKCSRWSPLVGVPAGPVGG